ncbi:MAG TPA: acyclic terpene utilization AtuA family protein, partial [Phnomibacter sp.]|nr:acyclic terpene utilization AtuA family protein [Phnomibacter sp.]
IMAVSGDNLMPLITELSGKEKFTHLETGEAFAKIADHLIAANVYTGSEGIFKALQMGADVVITGRASDSALTIGPLIYEMGWALDDWDKLAAAMVAGHVIECGAQACGGNFTDWEKVSNWTRMGYPIVEMQHDGSFLVSKGAGTGGLVNQWTVKEQLVYEIADPRAYIGPDVVADLSQAEVKDLGPELVQVSGIFGRPAPAQWKVSMAYKDGFKAVGQVVVGGLEAYKKAQLIDEIFWGRFQFSFDKKASNFIGADSLGDALAVKGGNEILLQFVAYDQDKSKLERFGKEIAGLILAGPQGMAAHGGRPKIQEVYTYWPSLIDRDKVKQQVWTIDGDGTASLLLEFFPDPFVHQASPMPKPPQATMGEVDLLTPFEGRVKVRMKDLCLARSGDKGNSANLGVLARSRQVYGYLKTHLGEDIIRKWLGDLCEGEIERYELDGMMGLNFMLGKALDGGGTRSSRLDPQGKMLAAAFLAQQVYVPAEIIGSVNNQVSSKVYNV